MKRSIWLYGLAMGLLLAAMQIIHYQTLIRDLRIELFGLIIAVFFMALGIWVGVSFYQRSQRRLFRKKTEVPNPLSDREVDVLLLMAEGFSNQEIADKLFVSLNTVKTHISSIYQKLLVKRRTQAVQKALDLGLISPPERVIR